MRGWVRLTTPCRVAKRILMSPGARVMSTTSNDSTSGKLGNAWPHGQDTVSAGVAMAVNDSAQKSTKLIHVDAIRIIILHLVVVVDLLRFPYTSRNVLRRSAPDSSCPAGCRCGRLYHGNARRLRNAHWRTGQS